MDQNLFIELNSSQMQVINGGTGISTALGFIAESLKMGAEAVWDFISTPGPGSETLMNCI